MRQILLTSLASVVAAMPAATQGIPCFEGATQDQLTVRTYVVGSQASTTTLPGVRKFRPIAPTAALANDAFEFDRPRAATLAGLPYLRSPNGGRLFHYERVDSTGHGLLWVDRHGVAADVYASQDQIDAPMSIARHGNHLAFAADRDLVLVKLDGSTYASTGQRWRTVSLPMQVLGGSVTTGTHHAFFVTDDDRVWRCGLADGATPEDITPAVGIEQREELCLAGDGLTLAFLRGYGNGLYTVHIAGGQGPSRQLALPARTYRQPNFLPAGAGQAGLLLNHDGSRLMVIEAGFEDEVHCIDTAATAAPWHVTGSGNFAVYIGAHILPKFRGNDLLLASGHAGWADWYLANAQGEVRNVTQTGSPEPPYFVGSLDVQSRVALQNGLELSIERLGTSWPLRRLDPSNQSSLVTATGIEAPSPGESLVGTPDLVLKTPNETLWVSGMHGGVRGALPTGLRMAPPLHSQAGFAATVIGIEGAAIAVPALLLDQGSLLLGDLLLGTAQLALASDGRLAILQEDRLQVLGPQGRASTTLTPAGFRILVGGAVAEPE